MPDDYDTEERPRKRRPDPDDEDADEDRPRKRRRAGRYDDDDRRRGADDGGVGYVIPYKNKAALAAYYVGILGLILCFLPPLNLFSGGAATVLGFMGMSRASKNPEAHGRAHAIVGIVLGIVQILALCGVGAFVVITAMASKK